MQKSGICRNVCFTISFVKFSCADCILRKGDLKMSKQLDLLESWLGVLSEQLIPDTHSEV